MSNDWRSDAGLEKITFYKKRFALLPKLLTDGTKIWFSSYFNKYELWIHPNFSEEHDLGHIDFIESITEQEYIVRKLAETL